MTLYTLFLALNKYFRQRLVLVLSTQYHTHPGCTQTSIETYFQSSLTKIHPCHLIQIASVQAFLRARTFCKYILSLKKYFRQRPLPVLSTQYSTHPGCSQTPME